MDTIVKILAFLMMIGFNLAVASAQGSQEGQGLPVFSGHGHSYEAVYVPGGLIWDQANAEAQNRGGYLATITSPEENAFVYNLLSGDKFWVNDYGY